MVKKKPVHMRNKSATRTICGLSVNGYLAFSWVISGDKFRADVTCKRCLHGLKYGWKQ